MVKRKTEPLVFLVDRLQTPIGELLIVADRAGNLRTIDWTDHEARMRQLLDRYYGKGGYTLEPARDPKLAPLIRKRPGLRAPGDWERETMVIAPQNDIPPAWRPWHAYAAQHLRMASHG